MPVTFAGDYYGGGTTMTGTASTATTWGAWNSTMTSAASNDTWITWNTTFTTTATLSSTAVQYVASGQIWSVWNDSYQGTTSGLYRYRAPAPQPPPTPEELAAREEQRRVMAERAAKQAEEHAAAIAKAKALLEGFLTSEQIAQLAAERWFEIISQKGHRYRIHQGQRGNVRRLNKDGSRHSTYCIHPGEYVPDEDAMLAQKLLLETDEDAFVRIANKS